MKEKKLKIMKKDLLEFFVTLECQYGHDFEFCRVFRKQKFHPLIWG